MDMSEMLFSWSTKTGTQPLSHWCTALSCTLNMRGMLGPHRSTSRIPTCGRRGRALQTGPQSTAPAPSPAPGEEKQHPNGCSSQQPADRTLQLSSSLKQSFKGMLRVRTALPVSFPPRKHLLDIYRHFGGVFMAGTCQKLTGSGSTQPLRSPPGTQLPRAHSSPLSLLC